MTQHALRNYKANRHHVRTNNGTWNNGARCGNAITWRKTKCST